jgi:tRNA (guanine-N7-)-methyltransferase
MGRKKALKKREVAKFPNVFSVDNKNLIADLIGYFNNKNKITLEIGCGDGDYTIALADRFPDRNFIGVDIKSDRIYNAASTPQSLKLNNVAFITGRFEVAFEQFKETKVEEIIIPFPEPHVRRTSAPRRLISNEFLELYKSILSDNGTVHFKSDNDGLFEFGIENLQKQNAEIIHLNRDVHDSEEKTLIESITTRYERHYLGEGRKINYVHFRFR